MAKKKKKKTSTSRPRRQERALPSLTRETFDLHWLDVVDSSDHERTFAEFKLMEKPDGREHVRSSLAAALVDHHIQRQRIADCLRSLNHEDAAEFFAEEMPKNHNTRMGNFGEVVASEHLTQRYGFSMPVFKLRYRDHYDMPMRGEDIVAFELDEDQRIVCLIIGEAKAIAQFRRSTVKTAHARLRSAFNPRPMTLAMLSNILYERGEDDLGRQLDEMLFNLTRGDVPLAHWIFVISESQPNDPFAVLTDEADELSGLCCASLPLPGLTTFVDELFDDPITGDTREI